MTWHEQDAHAVEVNLVMVAVVVVGVVMGVVVELKHGGARKLLVGPVHGEQRPNPGRPKRRRLLHRRDSRGQLRHLLQRLLLERGADFNRMDAKRCTVRDRAAIEHHDDTIHIFDAYERMSRALEQGDAQPRCEQHCSERATHASTSKKIF